MSRSDESHALRQRFVLVVERTATNITRVLLDLAMHVHDESEQSAAMPNIRPAAIAERYIKHIRAQDVAGVVALFAPHGTYTVPDGRRFTGAGEIAGWFTKLFASLALTPRVVATIESETAIAVEIKNVLPDGQKRSTANFFYLDSAGLITELRVYQQG